MPKRLIFYMRLYFEELCILSYPVIPKTPSPRDLGKSPISGNSLGFGKPICPGLSHAFVCVLHPKDPITQDPAGYFLFLLSVTL